MLPDGARGIGLGVWRHECANGGTHPQGRPRPGPAEPGPEREENARGCLLRRRGATHVPAQHRQCARGARPGPHTPREDAHAVPYASPAQSCTSDTGSCSTPFTRDRFSGGPRRLSPPRASVTRSTAASASFGEGPEACPTTPRRDTPRRIGPASLKSTARSKALESDRESTGACSVEPQCTKPS